MFDEKHPLYVPYKMAKRIVICIVGGTILLLGVVMMVTPGPGIPAILAGLAILGIEFAWARIWLKKAKAKAQEVARNITSKNGTSKNGTSKNGVGKNGKAPPPPAA